MCDYEHPEVTDILNYHATAAHAVQNTTPGSASSPAASTSSSTGPSSSKFFRTTVLQAPGGYPSTLTDPTKRIMELRLMHQWTTETAKTLAITAPALEEIWRSAVPALAFSGAQYLVDALLAIAALHLRSSQPNSPELMHASHSYMASSLAQYCAELNKGINEENAEALFVTSALIAFQSSASRIFLCENDTADPTRGNSSHLPQVTDYIVPISYFHSFQGVKAIVANSWRWLRNSRVVIPVINSQPILQLDFNHTNSFFGHLLDGMEEELATTTSPSLSASTPSSRSLLENETLAGDGKDEASTRQAYQHAVAVLNWAHKIPHRGAPLAFPATVSRRFVQLLEERRPRAIVILACFFALLKCLDEIWWLHGVARREVMGIAALFEGENRWRSKLEWPVRIALFDGAVIPPDVWGADWAKEERALLQSQALTGRSANDSVNYANHIDMLSSMVSAMQCLPPVKSTKLSSAKNNSMKTMHGATSKAEKETSIMLNIQDHSEL